MKGVHQMTKKMRGVEIAIGLSFIGATLFYGIGNTKLVEGVNEGIRGSELSLELIRAGSILELMNSLAVTLIGVLMYLRLKTLFNDKGFSSKRLAGYVITRVLEGLILGIGVLSVVGIAGDNYQMTLINHDYYFAVAMLV